jgi:hypothetical protein
VTRYVCEFVNKSGERRDVVVTLNDAEVTNVLLNFRTADLVARSLRDAASKPLRARRFRSRSRKHQTSASTLKEHQHGTRHKHILKHRRRGL